MNRIDPPYLPCRSSGGTLGREASSTQMTVPRMHGGVYLCKLERMQMGHRDMDVDDPSPASGLGRADSQRSALITVIFF